MALKPKDTPIQFRIDADSFLLFQQRCDHYEQTMSEALREAVRMMNQHYLEHAPGSDSSPSEAILDVERSSGPSKVEKQPVGPVNKPMSLSEKRKAEKAAKEARKARKEDRY